jgi:hypothetical protein
MWEVHLDGGVGEWLKPPDCKSGVRKGFVGSNPTPSTIRDDKILKILSKEITSPDSSAVEHVLGKNGVGGSIPPLGSSIARRENLNG